MVSRRKSRRNLRTGRHIPVRTFADRDDPPWGFLEIDLVACCGDNVGGSLVHSLAAIKPVVGVSTGWTEAVPLMVRLQTLMVAGAKSIAKRLTFPILCIGSDYGSVFFNEILPQHRAGRSIGFTRSGAYRLDDHAWVKQKIGV